MASELLAKVLLARDFTAKRVAIEKVDGTVVSERFNPAEHAEGKAVDAHWDALDRAFDGNLNHASLLALLSAASVRDFD